jgi:hypothetical protein
MKRIANSSGFVLAQCAECLKCLGFQLVMADHNLSELVGCFFWFHQFDYLLAPHDMNFRPVNLVPTHMNATINLSVALHTDPSQIDNHEISFIKD